MQTDLPTVVVIVLSWNQPHRVIACIGRVKRLAGARLDIVVIDNASIDDSVVAIRTAHPDVTILEEPVNRGYAGGVNRGLAEAAQRDADYAWLLNDDTAFEHDVMTTLLDAVSARASCGLWSPLLVDLEPPGRQQFERGLVDWQRVAMSHNLPDATHAARLAEGATAILPGTALLCDMRVWRSIGPFDERYFAYWEDTDYCVRAARAGFSTDVVPHAIVAHAAPEIADRPAYYHYYMVRNEALFRRLHHRDTTREWRARWLSGALQRLARNRDLGRRDNALACADGIWHAWRHRYGARADHPVAPRWFRHLLLSAPWTLHRIVDRWTRSA